MEELKNKEFDEKSGNSVKDADSYEDLCENEKTENVQDDGSDTENEVIDNKKFDIYLLCSVVSYVSAILFYCAAVYKYTVMFLLLGTACMALGTFYMNQSFKEKRKK